MVINIDCQLEKNLKLLKRQTSAHTWQGRSRLSQMRWSTLTVGGTILWTEFYRLNKRRKGSEISIQHSVFAAVPVMMESTFKLWAKISLSFLKTTTKKSMFHPCLIFGIPYKTDRLYKKWYICSRYQFQSKSKEILQSDSIPLYSRFYFRPSSIKGNSACLITP